MGENVGQIWPFGLEQLPHCRPTVKLKEEVVRLILEKAYLWPM